MTPIIIAIIGAVVGLVIVGIIVAHKREQQRQKDLAAFASSLGLSFDPMNDSDRDDQFSQFSIFSKGRRRTAWNTLSGELELGEHLVSVVMGDYRYTVSHQSGKRRSTRTYRLSYLIIGMPYEYIPKLLVRPENFFDKVAGFIGFDDIDFESDEFSRKYHVSSSNKRFAYDLIDARMMEFLIQTRGPVLDMESGWLCVVDGKRRWKVPEFQMRIDWLAKWLAHWPDHVVRSLGEGGYAGKGDE
jgi:hypothetical protein